MTLYRYEIKTIIDYRELTLKEYKVIRETQKCYVIKIGCKDKFIRREAKKKFAYETKEQALVNYIKRTKCWINNHLIPALDAAKIGLEQAKNIQKRRINEKSNDDFSTRQQL
jgi:hypothetical protein